MTARTARLGFTLIELLVVLAILGVLGSLILAAVMRTRTNQQRKTTEEHLVKMEASFARQRTAVFDTARAGSIPPVVMALAGNDADRARSLWAYIKYRRAFPNNFTEATSPIILTDPATGTAVALPELAAPQIFKNLPPAGGTTEVQAAACAYIFLTSRAERGEVMSMEEGAGSLVMDVDVGTAKVKVFKDTFGNPITFIRDGRGGDIDAPPYVKAGAPFRDPLDPLGRLTKPSAWTLNTALVNLTHTAAFGVPGTFRNENWMSTFVSAGADGKFPAPFEVDNIVGYRARQGN